MAVRVVASVVYRSLNGQCAIQAFDMEISGHHAQCLSALSRQVYNMYIQIGDLLPFLR